MESATKTFADLSLGTLKIMFADRLSPRRLACVEKEYDLLKYLWKELNIDDCYLEKYKINNRDEVSTHADAFSRHLLEFTAYTGYNEYAKQRLADKIEPISEVTTRPNEQISEEKKLKIHRLIRSEIASKWWDFGRYLDIKQGHLDTIGDEQKEVARKVDKVFEAFEENIYSADTYVDKVTNALRHCRRTDLAKKVCQIIEH